MTIIYEQNSLFRQKVAKRGDSKIMGKFDNKIANTGTLLLMIFSKCHTKVVIFVVSVIAKKSDATLSISFVISSNNDIKIAKPR